MGKVQRLAEMTSPLAPKRREVTDCYVAGLPDASGDFSGFWDDATAQTYSAASDGLSRNMYLYPDIQNSPSVYFFGQVLPDYSIDGAVGGPVNFKSTWNAASKITQYNPSTGGLS
jgi:hypothetical protein